MRLKKLLGIATILMLCAAIASAASFPSGTKITVRLTTEITSANARPGDRWQGSLERDVLVRGKVVARAGARVEGTVVRAKSSGRLKTPGILSLRLTSVNGTRVSTLRRTFEGKSHKKSNVTKIGGGAALGAIIGGIAGGGKGALIGAGAGGAAGTGVAAATGKMEVVLPAEAAITFTVSNPAPRK